MADITYRFERESYLGKPKKSGKGKAFLILLLVLIFVCAILYFGSKIFDEKEKVNENTTTVSNVEPKQNEVDKRTAEIKNIDNQNQTKVENKIEDKAKSTVETTKTEVVPVKPILNPEYEADLAELKSHYAKTDYQAVKQLALKMLAKYGEKDKAGPIYRKIGKLLSRLNMKMLFEGIPSDKIAVYKVDFGDNLNNIAIKYNLPVTAIVKANKLKGTTIYPGQNLKIYQGKWKIEVNKKANLLYVFDGDDLFCLYDVGIGKEGRTPEGEFQLTDKIEHPDWYSPDGRIVPYGDKENVLGTHWLKLEPINDTESYHVGYGIHGTWDAGEIAQSLSNGCIRMRNSDVAELFCYIPRQVIVNIY